mmetsp:Transcript_83943/g.270453  ORF Transcript_83943/g.270453 Transcript_83943/m.270453 type:complete len:271 (+) Transcript_83943:595-1407(+)
MIWLHRADTDLYFGHNVENYYAEQLGWLETAISKSTAAWKVVMGHHCLYTTGSHNSKAIRVKGHHDMAVLDDLMTKHGIVLYFNGHNHNQEVFEHKGVTYVTSGNGAKRKCDRHFGDSHIPEGASESNSNFFDCDGGFAGLTFVDAQTAELLMYDSRGHVFQPNGKFMISNAQSKVLTRSSFQAPSVDPASICSGVVLPADASCGLCKVLPDLPTVSSCADYCGENGLACVEAYHTIDGANDQCEVHASVGCTQKADHETFSLMCECGAK